MALNKLKLSNSKSTAKPVNGGGKLNAIIEALSGTTKISQAYADQAYSDKEKKLEKDTFQDEVNVVEAKANKKDVSKVDVKTVKGQKYRDNTYAQDVTNSNSREAQQESARAGESLKEAQARFYEKQQQDIMTSGTEEQKQALMKSQIALDNQYAQNIGSQELANAKQDKRDIDGAAIQKGLEMGQKPKGLSREGSREWDSNLAAKDMSVLVNQNDVEAAENGWTSTKKAQELRLKVDSKGLESKGNPDYVNSLYDYYNANASKINSKGAMLAVQRANEMNNKSEVAMSGDWFKNPMAPGVQETGLTTKLNNAILTGQISETNAKSAFAAEVNRLTLEGKPIPFQLMDFIKESRPAEKNGKSRAGWLYTDSSIRGLVGKNQTVINNLGSNNEMSSTQKAAIITELNDSKINGTLNLEQITNYEKVDAISESKSIGFQVDLIKQERQGLADLKLAEILENSDSDLSKNMGLKAFSLSGVDVEKSVNNLTDNLFNDSEGLEAVLTSDITNPKVTKLMETITATNVVPDMLNNMLNTSVDQSYEGFLSSFTLWKGMTSAVDSSGAPYNNSKTISKAVNEDQLKMFEAFEIITKNNSELSEVEIKTLLSKTNEVKNSYIPSDTYSRKDFKSDLNSTLDNIGGTNFLGVTFGEWDYSNKESIGEILTEKYNISKILDPDSSDNTHWQKAKQSVENNYTLLDNVLVFNSYKNTEANRVANYDTKMGDFRDSIAFSLLGKDYSGEDIQIVRNGTTEKTKLYDIRRLNTDGSGGSIIGETYLFEQGAKKDVPYMKGWADNVSDFERFKGVDRKEESSFSGISNYSTMNKISKKSMNPVMKNVADYRLVEGLSRSPLYKPKFSDKETKTGFYNVGNKKIAINDSISEKDKTLIIKDQAKRTKQKLSTEYGERYSKLSNEDKNEIAFRAMTLDDKNAIKVAAETVFKEWDDDLEFATDLISGTVDFGKSMFLNGNNDSYNLIKEIYNKNKDKNEKTNNK